MGTTRTLDQIVPDSEEDRASSSRGPKRRRRSRRNEHDEKYEGAMFEFLRKAEERSERMEMRMVENQRVAFEQAQKALDSYNMLSERIVHAIVNIGGSDVTSG